MFRKAIYIYSLLIIFLTGPILAKYPGLKIIKSNLNELELSYNPQILTQNSNDPSIIDGSEIELNKLTNKKQSFIKIPITVPEKNLTSIQNISIQYNKTNSTLKSEDIISLEYSGIARNRHISHLKILNSFFDSKLNNYITPDEIRLIIKFNGTISNMISKSQSNDDDEFAFTINHKETKNWIIPFKSQNIKDIKNKDIPLALSSGNWIKVAIESEGIYKIDASMISSLGFNISKSDLSTIKVFGNGGKELSEDQLEGVKNKLNEQQIIIKTNASGDLESILFYAGSTDGFRYFNGDFYHYINHYSNKNYYLLTWGGDNGVRANPKTSFADAPMNSPTTYTHKMFFEEELSNAFISGSGRQWFGRTIFPVTFSNMLDNLDKSGTVRYKISVAHRSEYPFKGYFQAYEAANFLGETMLPGISKGAYIDAYRKITNYYLPANKVSSDNRSVLKINYTNDQISSSLPFFDYYEIHYPRSFVAINNELNFWSDLDISGKTEFTINNFNGDIFGFDITDKKNPIQLKNLSSTGGLFIFRDSISLTPRNYYLSSTTKKPQLEKFEYTGIRENLANAELIIITPPEFAASALALKNYRQEHDNMTSLIVKTDNIFNEFASGIADPTAIRDFISYAYSKWEVKPKYILLWGAGHYDYKNISSQKKNFIPPYESEDEWTDFDAISSTCVEDFFVRIDGNDRMPDLAIGRMPIETPENGNLLVEKIKNYENNSSKDIWKDNIFLMADDSYKGGDDGDYSLHTGQSESLSVSHIPNDFLQSKVYLVEYPKENIPNGVKKPAVTEEMLNIINNKGALVLNWVGHGNPRVWAHETVLERETTIPLFKNKDKLFFLSAATCDFGRFDMPEVKCGSEEMLLKNGGGAIGVFSSSRVVISTDNAAINRVLFNNIFKRNSITGKYPRLGDIMYGVKVQRHNDNDEKFFLLGDPTLRLQIPEQVASIDNINGINLSSNNDTIKIKALTEVKISGSIKNYLDNSLDNSFNGKVLISVFDADKNIVAIDLDKSEHNIRKFGGTLNMSSALVKDGKFELSFIIPKDISFSSNTGRIFLYASNDNDTRSAKGDFNKVKFVANDSITSVDASSPKMKIYLESRNFIDGDVVSKTPLLIVDLFDEYGINASGTGIGHLIEAWIDDNPTSINLTTKFTSASDGTKNGTINDILSELPAGDHKIKIRAWNVYNKYTIGNANFKIVSDKDQIYISNIFVYPNPFSESTTIRFNHNLTTSFSYDLNIYNTLGQLVKNLSESKVSSQFIHEIKWDGSDLNGTSVGSGNYIFTLTINSAYGLSTTKYSGIIEKIR